MSEKLSKLSNAITSEQVRLTLQWNPGLFLRTILLLCSWLQTEKMLMVTVTKSQLSEFFLEFRALAFVPGYKEAIERSYSKLNGPLTK